MSTRRGSAIDVDVRILQGASNGLACHSLRPHDNGRGETSYPRTTISMALLLTSAREWC